MRTPLLQAGLLALGIAGGAFIAPAAYAQGVPSPSLQNMGLLCFGGAGPLNGVMTLTTPTTDGSEGFASAKPGFNEFTITAAFDDANFCGSRHKVEYVFTSPGGGTATYAVGFDDVRTGPVLTGSAAQLLTLKSATHNAASRYTYTSTFAVVPSDGVHAYTDVQVRIHGEGGSPLVLAARDASGTKSLTLDYEAPECMIDSPLENAVIGALPVTVQARTGDVRATASGVVSPITIDYQDGGGTAISYYDAADLPNANQQVAFTPDANASVLTNVTFSSSRRTFGRIVLKASDAVGNLCSKTRRINPDSNPPVFTRVLPIDRGFVTKNITRPDGTQVLTLEFRDDTTEAANDIAICNPASGAKRITLEDVTDPANITQVPISDSVNPALACNGAGYPMVLRRTDGTVPEYPRDPSAPVTPSCNVATGACHFYYTYIVTSGANRLVPDRSYQVCATNEVTDVAGNRIVDAPKCYPFTFFDKPVPLRVTKSVRAATGMGTGRAVEVGRDDAADPTMNCATRFGADAAAWDANEQLAKYTLTLVADANEAVDGDILKPFHLTDLLPPYFQVMDTRCTDSSGSSLTDVDYAVYDANGDLYQNLRGTLSVLVSQKEGNQDRSASGPYRNYGFNVDASGGEYEKGERGRRLVFPFDDYYMPGALKIPSGGRLEITYYAYVAGLDIQ